MGTRTKHAKIHAEGCAASSSTRVPPQPLTSQVEPARAASPHASPDRKPASRVRPVRSSVRRFRRPGQVRPVRAARRAAARTRAAGPRRRSPPGRRQGSSPTRPRPSSSAWTLTHQRNPTPCTQPSTTPSAGPGGPRRTRRPHLTSRRIRTGIEARHRASPPGAAGPGLTSRATVGRPVHERVAADRLAAAQTGLTRASVDREQPPEIAAFTVHVDVQRVERGPASRSASQSTSWIGGEQALAPRPCAGFRSGGPSAAAPARAPHPHRCCRRH